MSWSEWRVFRPDEIEKVPEEPGVYRLETVIVEEEGECLYIGKTDNLKRRLVEHLNSEDPCIKKTDVFSYLVTTSPERTEYALLKDYLQSHGKLPKCMKNVKKL